MNTRNYQRRHHRVGEKTQQQDSVSFLELDFRKTTIIIAMIAFIKGILIGALLKRR